MKAIPINRAHHDVITGWGWALSPAVQMLGSMAAQMSTSPMGVSVG